MTHEELEKKVEKMKEYKELVYFECKGCEVEPCIGEGACKKKHAIAPSKFFNGDYIEARNKLIPLAEEYANGKAKSPKGTIVKSLWNKEFHWKMNQLATSL